MTASIFPLEPTIAEAQQAIKDEFAFFGDWSERYQYLIDLGRKLPPFPDEWKTQQHRLLGCQSLVWIVPQGDANRLDFRAVSDSAIVSGLIYLALRVYSGRPAVDIVATEPDYIADIGLAKHLSAHPQQRVGRIARLHSRDGTVHRVTATAVAAVSPLRNRGFIGLLVYRLLAMLSYQIVAVTVGWHVYEITRDPLALGLIGLTEVVPYFCFALFAGYAVDHLPRRRLGMFACIGLLLTTLLLAGVASGDVPAFGTLTIYVAIAVNGVVRAFLAPVYVSLFAQVLPREQYARGAGIGSVVMQTGLVVGPALGGVMVAWSGKTSAYLLAAGFAAAAAIAIVSLRITEPPPPAERAPIFKSIGEGLRFVFNNQVVLGAQALDMFSVLFGGAVALLPAFIHEILHYGPEALGVLRAAPAAGAVLVGLWLARHPPQRNAGRLLLYAVAGFGLCIIGFAVSRSFWVSALMLMLSGMCDGVSVVLRSTILQLATPDAMRGRVSSINGIFIGSSNELGAFESGVAARLMGLVPSIIFGGCMTLAVVGVTAWKAPKLRRLDLKDLH